MMLTWMAELDKREWQDMTPDERDEYLAHRIEILEARVNALAPHPQEEHED